jgi:hypothetical protein
MRQSVARGNERTMASTSRIALFAALALLVALAGSALATRTPQVAEEPAQLASSHEAEADNEDADDDGDGWDRALERLGAAGIEADAAAFEELVARHGVGGATRIFAWADLTDLSVDDIAALRDGDGEPVGWGRIAKDLGVHPGIGSIMGRGNAPHEPPGLENRPNRDTDD